MALNIRFVLLLLAVFMSSVRSDEEWESRDRLLFEQYSTTDHSYLACSKVHPVAKDIVLRVYAMVSFFDTHQSYSKFLRKYVGTVNSMFESQDLLDREVGYYAAILTPVLFLKGYKDSWCFLERFSIAIRLFHESNPDAKRSALKVLQNLRLVNKKMSSFILNLKKMERNTTTTMSTLSAEKDDENDDYVIDDNMT